MPHGPYSSPAGTAGCGRGRATGRRSAACLAGGTPLVVRSHNARDVDVYVLCGDHDARWLGRIPPRGGAAFAISPAQRPCAEGLNFFLVARRRGYWVGPFRPPTADGVTLVIEKYAGLSSVSVDDLR